MYRATFFFVRGTKPTNPPSRSEKMAIALLNEKRRYSHAPYSYDVIPRQYSGDWTDCSMTPTPTTNSLPPLCGPPPPYGFCSLVPPAAYSVSTVQQEPWAVPSAADSPIDSTPLAADCVPKAAVHSSAKAPRRPKPLPNGDLGLHYALKASGCEYIPLPVVDPPQHWGLVQTAGLPRLFVGQVRFEVTAAQLATLIARSTGVSPARVESHRVGCHIVYLSSEADRQKVASLDRHVLFDINGAWLARGEAALATLHIHLESCDRQTLQRRHLPRSPIIVESMHFESNMGPR